jgi:phage gp45-like
MKPYERAELERLIDQRIIAKAPRPVVVGRVRSVDGKLVAALDEMLADEFQVELTPYHAPGIVGRLQEGQRVLIHSIGGLSNRLAYTGVNDEDVAPEPEPGDTIVYHTGGNGDYVRFRDGNIVEIKAAGHVDVDAPTANFSGDVNVAGKLTAGEIAAPSIKAAGVEVTAHDHAHGVGPGTTNPMGAP